MRFQCGFNDWVVELVGAFLHQLESYIPQNEDLARWKSNKNGDFGISSFYGTLRGSSFASFP